MDLRRLDALMKQVGELVVAKNRLTALSAEAADPTLVELSERIARLVSAMQTEVLAARMTPVGEVFERFPRLARDLSRDLGKRIRFDMEGEEIELDRSILDEIGEPLLHLIRNAADHGIEPPEQRAQRGQAGRGPHPAVGYAGAEHRGAPGGGRRPGHRPGADSDEGAPRRPGDCATSTP